MPKPKSDGRQFGRRRALIHALIVNERGVKKPCLVRNISMGGALLEVEEPQLVWLRFQLIVEQDAFQADCEVKHRTKHGVGVLFHNIRIERNGRDTRLSGPQLQDNMQSVMMGDIVRG